MYFIPPLESNDVGLDHIDGLLVDFAVHDPVGAQLVGVRVTS
jgi:hypothetical protein